MQRATSGWITRVWIVLLSLVFSSMAAAAGEAILVSASPAASTRHHEKLAWKETSPHRIIRGGGFVRCPGTCRLRLADGGQVDVAGGEVRVLPLRTVALPAGTRRGQTTGISVRSGDVSVRTVRRGLPVRVEGIGGSAMVLQEGQAWARAFENRWSVRLDAALAFRREGRRWVSLTSEPGRHVLWADRYAFRPPLTVPVWRPGPSHFPVALVTSADRKAWTLAWEPQRSATAATVTLTRVEKRTDRWGRTRLVDGARHVIERRDDGVRRGVVAIEARPGRYRVALRLTDAEGYASPWSKPLDAAVVPVRVPPGTQRPRPGVFEMAPGTELRFLDAPPLEVAMGREGFYHDPSSVPVDHAGGQMIVRLSDRPETASTYALQRRRVSATVRLAPLAPTWPDDVVVADVTIAGTDRPADVSMEVRLGRRRLDVTWTGAGPHRRALIRGRALRAPALLEVLVRDRHGNPLQRAFVEVVGRGRPR
ncbi:MAG: hypothetical protein AAGA56_10960 [Myxococcota bacterium]